MNETNTKATPEGKRSAKRRPAKGDALTERRMIDCVLEVIRDEIPNGDGTTWGQAFAKRVVKLAMTTPTDKADMPLHLAAFNFLASRVKVTKRIVNVEVQEAVPLRVVPATGKKRARRATRAKAPRSSAASSRNLGKAQREAQS